MWSIVFRNIISLKVLILINSIIQLQWKVICCLIIVCNDWIIHVVAWNLYIYIYAVFLVLMRQPCSFESHFCRGIAICFGTTVLLNKLFNCHQYIYFNKVKTMFGYEDTTSINEQADSNKSTSSDKLLAVAVLFK